MQLSYPKICTDQKGKVFVSFYHNKKRYRLYNSSRIGGLSYPNKYKQAQRFDMAHVLASEIYNYIKIGGCLTPYRSKKINNRVVQCLSDKKDKYKRYIAICYVDGVNLNQWLVLNGWAVAYQKYSKAYINAEAIARSQEVEIWSGEFILPWKWRRGKRLKK